MANLLDLMKPEDRKAAEDAYEKRMAGDSSFRKNKVSPVAYLLAEFGVLYGWEAIAAAKRGYIETFDETTGKKTKLILTMEEVEVLVDAGNKVKHSDRVNHARGTSVAISTAMSKTPKTTFAQGMKSDIEGAKL